MNVKEKKKFYHSSAWLRMRQKVLQRDHFECQRCKKEFNRYTRATTVHHIEHLEDNEQLALDPDNLISVCDACHNALHPEKGFTSNEPKEKFFTPERW